MPKSLRLSRSSNTPPRADIAGTFAASKMTVENPIVSAVLNQNTLTEITDQVTWTKLALRHTQESKLDAQSISLIQAKQKFGATLQSRSIASMMQSFESVMALDTVRNEYLLHSRLYQWLMEETDSLKVDALNDRVYAELFLTPKTDPWLGLLPSNSYSAIDNDGILNSN